MMELVAQPAVMEHAMKLFVEQDFDAVAFIRSPDFF